MSAALFQPLLQENTDLKFNPISQGLFKSAQAFFRRKKKVELIKNKLAELQKRHTDCKDSSQLESIRKFYAETKELPAFKQLLLAKDVKGVDMGSFEGCHNALFKHPASEPNIRILANDGITTSRPRHECLVKFGVSLQAVQVFLSGKQKIYDDIIANAQAQMKAGEEQAAKKKPSYGSS